VIKIRGVTRADFATLHALDQICFRPGIAYSKAELKHLLSDCQSVSFVAEAEDGSISGFAIAELRQDQGKQLGHIVTIDVAPETRRQGVGHWLMDALEKELRAKEAAAMWLEVAADNDVAQEFYRRHGYEQAGRIPRYYNNDLDALVMTKLLV
jgi:ribosomal-protein-alanine N-acetyltransferase